MIRDFAGELDLRALFGEGRVFFLLVQDRPGVMNGITEVLARSGANLRSLTGGPSEDAGISRIAIRFDGSDVTSEEIATELRLLDDVIVVVDVTYEGYNAREFALIEVTAAASLRPRVIEIACVFGAKVLRVAPGSLTIEATGIPDEIDALVELLGEYGVRALARTGPVPLGPSRDWN